MLSIFKIWNVMVGMKKVFYLAEDGKAKAPTTLNWYPTNSNHKVEKPI